MGGTGIMHQGFSNYSVFSYRPVQASGGTVSDILVDGRPYRVHKFTNIGASSLVVHNAGTDPSAEYILVGGGAGGGSNHAGGGGAGAFRSGSFQLSSSTYPVTVGSGGAGSTSNTTARGASGNHSAFAGNISIGGGGGGNRRDSGTVGLENGDGGGSGGGGGGQDATTGYGGASYYGDGNSGGNSFPGTGAPCSGGGGGGAGSAGANGTSYRGGNGGAGIASSITGSIVYYAAGGGGGAMSDANGVGGSGGNGGGGNGGYNTTNPTSGAANTGSGGGGGKGAAGAGAAGGSGVVIVRYPIGPTVPQEGISATGGNVADITVNGLNYRTHTFNSSGLFIVSGTGNLGGQIEYLSVAGGGGGSAGGGGAGGLLSSSFNAQSGLYSIGVGTGGAQGGYDQRGANGTNSSILAVKSYDQQILTAYHNNGYTTNLVMDMYYVSETSSSITYGVSYAYAISSTNTSFINYTLDGYVQINGAIVWSSSPNTQYSISSNDTITVATGYVYMSLTKGQQTGIPVYASLSAAGPYGFTSSTISNNLVLITNNAISVGGGGGGHYWGSDPNGGCAGASGGSGGGGGMNMNFSAPGGTAVSGQGYAGGSADYTGNAKDYGGGGGGGAGGAGSSYAAGSSGGPGITSSISGTSKYYAAGGGPSSQAISNTGHGGAPGQAGSSGVVVIRYRIP